MSNSNSRRSRTASSSTPPPVSNDNDHGMDPLTLPPPRPQFHRENSNASGSASSRSSSPNTSYPARRASPSSYEGRNKYSGSPEVNQNETRSTRSLSRNSTPPSSRRTYYQQQSEAIPESPKQTPMYFSSKKQAENSPKLSPTPSRAPSQQQQSGARLTRHISFSQRDNNDGEGGRSRAQGLGRQRSLVRHDRQRPKPSLIRSNSRIARAAAQEEMSKLYRRRTLDNQRRNIPSKEALTAPPPDPRPEPIMSDKKSISWWAITAIIATACFPNFCLGFCLKKKDPIAIQAWREKITLCYIILIFCAAIAFLTFGFHDVLCPEQTQAFDYSQVINGKYEKFYRNDTMVQGQVYDFNRMKNFLAGQGIKMNTDYEGLDLSTLFDADVHNYCVGFDNGLPVNTHGFCSVDDPYGGTLSNANATCLPLKTLTDALKPKGVIVFDWMDITAAAPDGTDSKLTVIGDKVYNFTYYMDTQIKFFGDVVHDTILRSLGNDGSLYFYHDWESRSALPCIETRYLVGVISTETMGCFAADIIMDVALIVIVALISIRFIMALLFSWFISSNLIAPGGRKGLLAWRSVEGGNYDPANRRPLSEITPYQLASYPLPPPPNRAAMSGPGSTGSGGYYAKGSSPTGSFTSLSKLNQTLANQYYGQSARTKSQIYDSQLYTAMLVTCYSEGESSLRGTLDSLAETTYSTRHKIIFVVCDGMILGSGNEKTTPDIIRSMMEIDSAIAEPHACHYIAIADGERQLNMAKVYAGHYVSLSGKARVPIICVVKVGTPEEAELPKPGNRGKRDSQLILMTFFQRVLFNDRFTELDYEIFWKMTMLMNGVTPDRFEVCLMVDADTIVKADSLTYMVAAMSNDITIMGLCGETRIANKRASWVAGIQVFEYYISHHYAKAFESVFGGVSCLPGCFSMYRIKAPKNGGWVPILANPDIIMEYNQNVVTTLHAKNLLLLGEDRFLSTLMLRTFPKRQMMFIPQAKCKTIVPDKFSVLLSQRRRWINSTIHNLMELTLVSDLCGIACLSMQFAVLIELIGTIVLPAAICLTIYLIIDSIVSRNPQWIALALLGAILGLPAVLIVMTSRKMVYVVWMLVYLCALFIWNFVLPVYAYWHFDDFSWGETRKVAGDLKGVGHGDAEGEFDSSQIVMKKWEEWERARLGGRISVIGSRSSIQLNNSSSNLSNSGDAAPLSPPPPLPLPRPVSAVNLPTQLVTPESINNPSPNSGSPYNSSPRQSANNDSRTPSSQVFNYPVPSSRYNTPPPVPAIPLQTMNGHSSVSSHSSDRPLLSTIEHPDSRTARSAPSSMSRSSVQFTKNQPNVPPVPSPPSSQNYQRSPSPMLAPQPVHATGIPTYGGQQLAPQNTQSPPPLPPPHNYVSKASSPPPSNGSSKSDPVKAINRRSLTRPPVPTFAQNPPPNTHYSGPPEMSADITSSQMPMGGNAWGGLTTNQSMLAAPSSSKSDNWSIGQNSDTSFSDDVFSALDGSTKMLDDRN